MDNIIKFPSRIYEKERELKVLEVDLAMRSLEIKRESQKVKNQKRQMFFAKLVWLSLGLVIGSILTAI